MPDTGSGFSLLPHRRRYLAGRSGQLHPHIVLGGFEDRIATGKLSRQWHDLAPHAHAALQQLRAPNPARVSACDMIAPVLSAPPQVQHTSIEQSTCGALR